MGMVITINGTSTDVGKTIATAALATWFASTGKHVAVFKPAQTGGKEYDGDVETVARLCQFPITTVEGFRLQEPLAPVQAAALEGVQLPDITTHVNQIESLLTSHDVVFVEGSGGLLVELDANHHTMVDIIKALTDRENPVPCLNVLVAHPGLGTLNHIALSSRLMMAEGLHVDGVVVGCEPAEDDLAGQLNMRDIPFFAKAPIICMLPPGLGCLTSDEFFIRIARRLSENKECLPIFSV